MFNIRSLGQQKQSDDIQYLKKKLKECYAAEGDTDRCAEIAKLLRSAIDRFNKEQGIQSPGGFLPQVPMQDSGYEGYPNVTPIQYGVPTADAERPPAPQYSWNQQLPDLTQDYAQQSMLPLQVARNAGLDPMAQNSWNQNLDMNQGQAQGSPLSPQVARNAGLDPMTQNSWNQNLESEEDEIQEGTLSRQVARSAGLDPMNQYSWNQQMSMGGRIPLSQGLGWRALGVPGDVLGHTGHSLGQMSYKRDEILVDKHKAYKDSLKSGDKDAIDKAYSEYREAYEAREAEMPLRDEMERLREQNREDMTYEDKRKAVQDRIAEMEKKWPGWDKSRSYWEEFSRTGVNPNYPEWYKTAGKAAEKALELALQAAPLIPFGRGIRPPVRTPGGVTKPAVATPRSAPRSVATPGSRGGTAPTPQPQSTMPTKPMTPEGPLMGPPVATPRGNRIYKGTEGPPDVPVKGPMGPENMPAGYGPQPKSVFIPPDIPTWYDPKTGKPYSPIPDMQDYIRQGHKFDVPFPASGRRNMPPGKPFSKGEGEPEREAVASVDPRTQCPPGQFWDGRQCRGSVGSIPSLPGGLPGSVAANSLTVATPGVTGIAPGMSGRRSFRVVNCG